MTRKQTSKRSGRAEGNEEAEGNVDKIRDILFGSQMRDYDSRLDAMEKRLIQSVERSAKDMERRIDRLDKYARREIEKLSDQAKADRKDRNAEDKQRAADINRLGDLLETGFAEVDEQLSQESKDLRDSLHDQVEDLTGLIRETQSQLQSALQKETDDLRDAKLAREDMAELLTEVAMRLNKDFKLPKA